MAALAKPPSVKDMHFTNIPAPETSPPIQRPPVPPLSSSGLQSGRHGKNIIVSGSPQTDSRPATASEMIGSTLACGQSGAFIFDGNRPYKSIAFLPAEDDKNIKSQEQSSDMGKNSKGDPGEDTRLLQDRTIMKKQANIMSEEKKKLASRIAHFKRQQEKLLKNIQKKQNQTFQQVEMRKEKSLRAKDIEIRREEDLRQLKAISERRDYLREKVTSKKKMSMNSSLMTAGSGKAELTACINQTRAPTAVEIQNKKIAAEQAKIKKKNAKQKAKDNKAFLRQAQERKARAKEQHRKAVEKVQKERQARQKAFQDAHRKRMQEEEKRLKAEDKALAKMRKEEETLLKQIKEMQQYKVDNDQELLGLF